MSSEGGVARAGNMNGTMQMKAEKESVEGKAAECSKDSCQRVKGVTLGQWVMR